ncbi:major facilitator superfamily domain-containing protein [Plectosphaerella cucumerina]|uniref:Major facilitator superfamily domain-containing protein n=1 Tax=Plectosphaerella cucumerina TaxID=40658 RepID=A0A8K0TII3_9PEZI|nr:major facilitator superfamily domain-containing protein [Plectosphaerella cucumerina]
MASDPIEVRDSGEKEQMKERSIGVIQSDMLKRAGKNWVLAAFAGLYLFTLVDVFNKYSTSTYAAYATSAFRTHSMLSASRVVETIAMLLSYPIIARLSDMFGRFEMFAFSVFLSVLSLILLAACQNIQTYFVGGLFDAIGSVGFGITQQIFISDLTNLRNRAFWLSLPETISAVPTLYLGTIVAQAFLDHSTWRWGYGMWAIVTPVVALPLLLTLFIRKLKDRKQYPADVLRPRVLRDIRADDPLHVKAYQLLWIELDAPGCFLLIAGLALILIPVSLTGARNSGAWENNGGFIAMVVIGAILFVAFVVWDYFFAKKPFIPFRLIKDRTIIAACTLCILDFIHYSLFSVFFPSYLQVAGHFSPGHATRIDNSLRVSFQIVSMVGAIGMRYTKRAKIWVLIGVPLCVLGQGLQIYFVNINGERPANEASFIVAKVLVGIGRGLYQTAAQVAVQAVVARDEVAIATGVFFASMNLGGAIGTSISGAIWRSNLVSKLTAYLPTAAKGQANAIFGSIVVAQKYAAGTVERAAIDQAYRETQELLAIAATCALAPMIIAMWFIKNVDLTEDEGVEEEERRGSHENQVTDKVVGNGPEKV